MSHLNDMLMMPSAIAEAKRRRVTCVGRWKRGLRNAGYGCIRKWGRGLVIGPVVAATGGDARALIATLAAFHLGRFIRINLPAHTGLSPWLESIGLPLVYSEVAMTLGEAPETGRDSTLFVQSNPSLG